MVCKSDELPEQDEDAGEVDERFEHLGKVLVADAQTAEDFQFRIEMLDLEPALVASQRAAVLPLRSLAVLAVRRDQFDAAIVELIAQRVAVGRLVVEQVFGREAVDDDRVEHRFNQLGLRDVGRRDRYADGQTVPLGDRFDLGAFADFSDADVVPPFAAGTNVASPAPSDQSSAPAKWSSHASSRKTLTSVPSAAHCCSRRQHVAKLGKCFGNFFHCAPVRRIQMMPSRQGRGGTGGRPPFGFGGGSGIRYSIVSHCSSVSSVPIVQSRAKLPAKSKPPFEKGRGLLTNGPPCNSLANVH